MSICVLLPALAGMAAEPLWSLDVADATYISNGWAVPGGDTLTLENRAGQQRFTLAVLDGPPPVAGRRLVYKARLSAHGVQDKAYLEILCRLSDGNEYFGRALQNPVGGDTANALQETYFFLQQNQQPDRITLNVVIEGPGTIEVHEASLVDTPLDAGPGSRAHLIGLIGAIAGSLIGLAGAACGIYFGYFRSKRQREAFAKRYSQS